jgi:hypothetical protein
VIQELSQSELLLAVRSTDSRTEEDDGSNDGYSVDDILEVIDKNNENADTAVSVSLLEREREGGGLWWCQSM